MLVLGFTELRIRCDDSMKTVTCCHVRCGCQSISPTTHRGSQHNAFLAFPSDTSRNCDCQISGGSPPFDTQHIAIGFPWQFFHSAALLFHGNDSRAEFCQVKNIIDIGSSIEAEDLHLPDRVRRFGEGIERRIQLNCVLLCG